MDFFDSISGSDVFYSGNTFRNDDIPQQVADDIQGCALIYLQKHSIIKSSMNRNLTR